MMLFWIIQVTHWALYSSVLPFVLEKHTVNLFRHVCPIETMCPQDKSPWRPKSYFSQSTFVFSLPPAQWTKGGKGWVIRRRLEMWSGAFVHCQFVTVSRATGELHSVMQEGFDTRRPRHFWFLSSQRRRYHVRKPQRRDNVGVNDAFFPTQSGDPAAEVGTLSRHWFCSVAPTLTAAVAVDGWVFISGRCLSQQGRWSATLRLQSAPRSWPLVPSMIECFLDYNTAVCVQNRVRLLPYLLPVRGRRNN